MTFDRRMVLIAGAAGAAFATMPLRVLAQDGARLAGTESVDDLIAAFTGGTEATEGDGIRLNAPEIAENGNTVPVDVDAPGAVEIMMMAPGNPTHAVFRAKFGELAGAQKLSTRIRLAETQDIIAYAKLGDGSFLKASSNVKVTIGGCGG